MGSEDCTFPLCSCDWKPGEYLCRRFVQRVGVEMTELALHKSEGKPQVGDIDLQFITEMGKVMSNGLFKYPNDVDGMPNWWKGGSYRSFIASIQRHLVAFAAGQFYDDESGLPHLAHAAVDAMFLWSWKNRGVGKDDRLVEGTDA